MEFRVLGPIEASSNGTVVQIGAAQKLRLVLAALLSRADRVVAPDWLISVVWVDQPPASARRNLQLYIHQLRTAMGSDRIASQPGGYVIRAEDGLDAARFRRLAAQGSAALASGDAAHAGQWLREALNLWHGPAYAEFTDCPAIADEATRLEQLRLTVYEGWAEAELRLGHHSGLVDALSDLVRTNPYRENLRSYLMRALYGAGRQADALQLFRDTRAILAEQLGIEPGPQLQRLHEQMLRGDSQLAPRSIDPAPEAPAAIHGGAGVVPVPHELPADVSGFTGRENSLKALDEMLPEDAENTTGRVVVSAITGTAGVGKTALALHWSHRVADRFHDGQLYVDLRGYAPGRPLRPIEALTALLRRLGIRPGQVRVGLAEAAARYRSHLAGRRMLIVLDNARSSEQIRPLLPASPGCMVLITSRDRLTGLAAKEGVRRITLDVLNPDESVDLLGQLLGRERAAAEPAAAAALAQTCAHLPLALRIAAACLADQPHRAIASYVAELTERDPVSALAIDGDDRAVHSAFDLSYLTLPQPAQQMFRRLGLVPCPDFTAPAAAALAGIPESGAQHALEVLAAAHLLVQRMRAATACTSCCGSTRWTSPPPRTTRRNGLLPRTDSATGS